MDFRPGSTTEARERAQIQVLGGRYEVGGLLGCGANSNVYRARDRRTRHELAVKTFLPGPSFVRVHRRWQRQLAIASTLRHPGLVSLLDVHPADDTAEPPFLILELVSGPTLDRYLRNGALTEVQVAALGSAVCEALTYLHSRRVVHRAIKPTNVLLADPENPLDLQPKLTDFGLGLVVDNARMARLATIGTANYFSPEQVRGAPVGAATDVYALGLVLIEALTGETVFAGHGIEMARVRLERDPLIPAGICPAFADLLTRMTTRTATDRPSAAAVGAELDDIVAATAQSDLLAMEYAATCSAHRAAQEASRTRQRLGALVVAGVSVAVLAASDGLGGEPRIIGSDLAPLATSSPSDRGVVIDAKAGATTAPRTATGRGADSRARSGRDARSGAPGLHRTPPSRSDGSRVSKSAHGRGTAHTNAPARAVTARQTANHDAAAPTRTPAANHNAGHAVANNAAAARRAAAKNAAARDAAARTAAARDAAAKAAAAKAAARRAAAAKDAADAAAAARRAAARRAAAARQAAAEKAAADARRARRAAGQKPPPAPPARPAAHPNPPGNLLSIVQQILQGLLGPRGR